MPSQQSRAYLGLCFRNRTLPSEAHLVPPTPAYLRTHCVHCIGFVFPTASREAALLQPAEVVPTCPSVFQIPRLCCCSPLVFLQIYALKKKSSHVLGEGVYSYSVCHPYLEVGMDLFLKKAINSVYLNLRNNHSLSFHFSTLYRKETIKNRDKSFHFGVHCSIYQARN